MEDVRETSATCDLCGSLFHESRKRYYCDHCHKYYFVCPRCVERGAKCRFCGIPTKKHTEPVKLKHSV